MNQISKSSFILIIWENQWKAYVTYNFKELNLNQNLIRELIEQVKNIIELCKLV